ncbi:hypothetical protein GALL_422920 [mine drainage metagenome]|uniref:Uncharacterized protein n=1 Tax=mine drainage metagenome TaxID=410659 RepID=A0A1J5PX19_9ZZZZ
MTVTTSPDRTTIPAARSCAAVSSESWLPPETTVGTSLGAADAKVSMQYFSTAVPSIVESPALRMMFAPDSVAASWMSGAMPTLQ